jgi:RNA polymerase sigma factor (sigma-70 family)
MKLHSKACREIPVYELPEEMLGIESAPSLPVSVDFDFDDEKISTIVNDVNKQRRQILTLIFRDGLTAQETAEILGCTVAQVYKHKHYAIKKIRDQLIALGGRHGK